MGELSKLEYKLLFAIIVAGKSAKFAQEAMDRLQQELARVVPEAQTWFSAIRIAADRGCLLPVLLEARVGNYNKTRRAFAELAKSGLDLETCAADQLEQIHGIGPKTARFSCGGVADGCESPSWTSTYCAGWANAIPGFPSTRRRTPPATASWSSCFGGGRPPRDSPSGSG